MQPAHMQDKLFRRMMMLLLLMGILIGIVLTLSGLNLSNFIAKQMGAPLLAEPLGDGLSNGIYPYYFLLFGAFLLLYGKYRAVRKQLEIAGHLAGRPQNPSDVPFFYFLLGGYCLLFGGVSLLVGIFALNPPLLLGLLLFPGGLLVTVVVIVVSLLRHGHTQEVVAPPR